MCFPFFLFFRLSPAFNYNCVTSSVNRILLRSFRQMVMSPQLPLNDHCVCLWHICSVSVPNIIFLYAHPNGEPLLVKEGLVFDQLQTHLFYYLPYLCTLIVGRKSIQVLKWFPIYLSTSTQSIIMQREIPRNKIKPHFM